MRICYVCSFKEDSGGGVSQVVFNMAKYFSQEHDVLVIVPGVKTGYFFDTSRGMAFLEVGCVGKGLLYVPRFGLIDVVRIYRWLRLFSPQVIHLHDEGPIPLLLLSFSKFLSISSVLSFHMDPRKRAPVIDDLFDKFNFVFSSKNNIRLTKMFSNMVDMLCFPDACIKKSLDEICESKRYLQMPNFIDLKEFNIGRNINRFSLVFVGHVIFDKGCDYLVECVRYLPQKYNLTLIGDTPNPKYYRKLKEKIKKYNLKNINFLGKIPHSQIPAILATSQLFVSASLLEVQSLAVLESLASGTPVVSLANSTTNAFIDEKIGGNFPPSTPPSVFAKKIQELCELDDKNYEQLCENSKNKVAHLDLGIVGAKTLKVYEKLISYKTLHAHNYLKLKYAALAFIFAKCVRILYFLEGAIQTYEKIFAGKSEKAASRAWDL